MEEKDILIPLEHFCSCHRIDIAFIDALEDQGLVEIIRTDSRAYLGEHSIAGLEKMTRLHEELDINPEGIMAVMHLLQRIESMQEEIRMLRNRLSRYDAY